MRQCGFQEDLVDPRRVLTLVELRHSSYAHQSVSTTAQHELLERADTFPVARLGCPKDTLSQITNTLLLLVPVNTVPVGIRVFLGSVC